MVSHWRDDRHLSCSLVRRQSYFPVSSFLLGGFDGLSVCANRYRIGTTPRIVRGSPGGCFDWYLLLSNVRWWALGFRCSGGADDGFHDCDPDNSPTCRGESAHHGAPPCRYVFPCATCRGRRFHAISGGNSVEPCPSGQEISKQMVVREERNRNPMRYSFGINRPRLRWLVSPPQRPTAPSGRYSPGPPLRPARSRRGPARRSQELEAPTGPRRCTSPG